eukprot:7729948-Pyramimonas_sp.AAC.1
MPRFTRAANAVRHLGAAGACAWPYAGNSRANAGGIDPVSCRHSFGNAPMEPGGAATRARWAANAPTADVRC